MEQWERDIITENLSKLIKITDCNTLLLTELRKTVLGLEDMEYLEDISIKLKRAKALYDLIVKKHNGFRILIETFLEPELSQDAPAILLITKAKEKGKGHGLPKLPSQNLSSTTTPDTVDSSPPTQGGNERQVQAQLPEELEKFVCKGKELTVNVIQPQPGVQVLTEKPKYLLRKDKNYALILNITEFYNEDMNSEYIEFDKENERQGGEKDTEYMEDLLKGLGYKIFPEKKLLYSGKWTKKVIEEELERFYDNCNQHDVDSMVVFLGSHGREGHEILTSDKKWLDVYNEVIYRLQSKKIGNLQKPVAKIFILESCQKAQNDRQLHHSTLSTPTPPPNCEDTILISAQMVKYEAFRDIYCGSYFVLVLVFVLMTQSWNTPLDKMLENSQELLKRMSQRLGANSFQVNPFSIIGLKTPFYFFPR